MPAALQRSPAPATAATGQPDCQGGRQGAGQGQPYEDATLPELSRAGVLDDAGVRRGVRRVRCRWRRCDQAESAIIVSTLLDVDIDRDDAAALHSQVAAQIRQAIAGGEAKPGERLPPARHLAAVMGVNTNTVLRALRQLREEGLIEMRPRRGIHVTGTPQQGELRGRVAELVALARDVGCTRAELLEMVASAP